MDGWMVARLRFDDDVCVGGFAVNLGSKFVVVIAGDVNVKKGDAFVNLRLSCKFDARVYAVEDIVKRFGGVDVGG